MKTHYYTWKDSSWGYDQYFVPLDRFTNGNWRCLRVAPHGKPKQLSWMGFSFDELKQVSVDDIPVRIYKKLLADPRYMAILNKEEAPQ